MTKRERTDSANKAFGKVASFQSVRMRPDGKQMPQIF